MKLRNNFKTEDKMRVWLDSPYCALCDSNQGCALHHIFGRCSSSIYNGIMLCHTDHVIADGKNGTSDKHEEYRQELLEIAIQMVEQSGHTKTQIDKDFLKEHWDE